MNKKWYIFSGIAVIVLLSAGTFFVVGNKKESQITDVKGTQTTQNIAKDPITGLEFTYDSALKVQELSQQDISDKFIFRLASTNPAILVSIRYEEGLSAVSALANQDVYDILATNTLKALPQRYPDFKLQTQQKIQLAGREALDVVFTYTGPNGNQATQRFVVLVKDPNTAIYISAQTSSTEYEDLNNQYIDKLVNSIKL